MKSWCMLTNIWRNLFWVVCCSWWLVHVVVYVLLTSRNRCVSQTWLGWLFKRIGEILGGNYFFGGFFGVQIRHIFFQLLWNITSSDLSGTDYSVGVGGKDKLLTSLCKCINYKNHIKKKTIWQALLSSMVSI